MKTAGKEYQKGLFDATLVSCFQRACNERGDREFFTDPTLRLSGTDCYDQTIAFASAFNKHGINKGDVIAFLCQSSVLQSVAFFACQILGAVPCCLHVNDTPSRLSKTLEFVSAKLIIADHANLDVAQNLATKQTVISLADEGASNYVSFLAGGGYVKTFPQIISSDLGLILLSSGTTGSPKCVLHTQKTLAATASIGRFVYDCPSPNDSVIVTMGPSFAAWIHTVLPFVNIAGRIHFDKQFEPKRFLQTIQDERISVVPLVPTVWRMVLASGPQEFDLSNVSCAFFSGEPGSTSLVHNLSENFCSNVFTAYLASEGGNASGVVAGSQILNLSPNATGTPVPGGEVRVINPEGDLSDTLPTGMIGEVVVRGCSVSPGYLKQPDLTAARFIDGWWRSGDLGLIDEKGILFIKGRLDNQINTGAIKVSAEEIEAALLQHPDIQLVGVVGEPDAQWGERIEAHIVTKGNLKDGKEVFSFIEDNELLPRHLWPKAIHFREKLPLGPTGKLYRKGLQRQ